MAAFDTLKGNIPRLLICADYFHPAHHAGGAARALFASVRALDQRYSQWIITRNHDLGNERPYLFLEGDQLRSSAESWRPFGDARIWYAPSPWRAIARLPRLLHGIRPDLIYLNSLFSPFTRGLLLWRRLGVGAAVPVLLAPRGELAPAALRSKNARKRLWIMLARAMGLFTNVRWQASSEKEAAEVKSFLNGLRLKGEVVVIPEIVAVPQTIPSAMRGKQADTVRLCVLGRISPIKNIDGILRAVRLARGNFIVDAIGPMEDPTYAATCRALQDQLPPNVSWHWHGALSPERALSHLEQADVLVAPSHSENFGHAIAEALVRGIPVIVGTNTPWSDVARHGAGWSIVSTDERRLVEALEGVCALSGEAFTEMCDNARRYAAQRIIPAAAADSLAEELRTMIAADSVGRSDVLP